MPRYLVPVEIELHAASGHSAATQLRTLLGALMLDGDISRAYVGDAERIAPAGARAGFRQVREDDDGDTRAE